MAKKVKILTVPTSCIKDHVGLKSCSKVCDGCFKTLSDMYKNEYKVIRK